MVRPKHRGTGCTDRQQTIQTVTARLGDFGEPNVPRGTLGSAKSGRRDGRPSPIGDLTVRWAKSKNKRPSPTVLNGESSSLAGRPRSGIPIKKLSAHHQCKIPKGADWFDGILRSLCSKSAIKSANKGAKGPSAVGWHSWKLASHFSIH